MSLIRDLGLVVQSLEDKAIITASTAAIPATAYGLLSTVASTGNVLGATSTGSAVITGNGRVIDRLSDLFTKGVPLVAVPSTRHHVQVVDDQERSRFRTLDQQPLI